MKIKEIYHNDVFEKQFLKLPFSIQQKAILKEILFKKDPFHPSLRLHKLKGKLSGLWCISIDKKYRLIFEPVENGIFLFHGIGKHSIYDSL